jgi:hypothetical protein
MYAIVLCAQESIRKNFILIYELLDEMLDFGYPQITSTETLKQYVHNEPVMVQTVRTPTIRMPSINPRTVPSNAVQKPISLMTGKGSKQKNEIFVVRKRFTNLYTLETLRSQSHADVHLAQDILERLNILFSPNGTILNSNIDGCIQMKSYLSGNPELRLALNEDLVIGKGGSYGSVVLDDCNFHECVRLDEFEAHRTLSFIPPDGRRIFRLSLCLHSRTYLTFRRILGSQLSHHRRVSCALPYLPYNRRAGFVQGRTYGACACRYPRWAHVIFVCCIMLIVPHYRNRNQSRREC